MANLLKCKRCGADIRPTSEAARNQAFCGFDCRETWWNEARSKRMPQSEVASKRLGVAAPDFSLTDVQASWLAALIDGEGTIGIWREKRTGNVSGYRFRAAVEVGNTNAAIIDQVRFLIDGHMSRDWAAWNKNPKHKLLYRAKVNRRAVLPLLRRVREYLIIKQRQAGVVMQFCEAVHAAPMRTAQSYEVFEALYNECKALNKRGT